MKTAIPFNLEIMVIVGQSQLFDADNINIQTPSEFTITLTMSGSFEIIKNIANTVK